MPEPPAPAVPAWLGPADRPLLSWWSTPSSGGPTTGVGVVVVPSVGYEAWTSHRTLRTLAERLAGIGCTVVRYDADATGDSAGGSWDGGRVAAWRQDVARAVEAVRASGASSVVLCGLGSGATMALEQAAAVGADGVVAWAPAVSGRRLVRQLRLMATPVPDDPAHPDRSGAYVQAGTVLTAETLADLAAIDLLGLAEAPAPRILLLERDDRPPEDALAAHLGALGSVVDRRTATGTEAAADRPTEYAEVPTSDVATIVTWAAGAIAATGRAGPGAPSSEGRGGPAGAAAAPTSVAQIPWDGTTVDEAVVHLGSGGLVGIQTTPSRRPRATVLWLNSGSEHHVGPGRAWVEYARALALSGFASVRIDLSGWGESPDHGHAPGRPYDPHCVAEATEAARDLADRSAGPVVVAGLCAGAWVALAAALDAPFDGVIALNPQLYWQPGDPVEADIVAETHVRRLPEIARIERWRRFGAWSALDAVGLRPPAARWLRRLAATGTPVLLVFAEGDDGLGYLEGRTGRTWRAVRRNGTLERSVVAGIDHPMHRQWLRPRMVDELHRWLDQRFPAP